MNGANRLRKLLLYSSAFTTMTLVAGTWFVTVDKAETGAGVVLAIATAVSWLHTYFWSTVDLQWVGS